MDTAFLQSLSDAPSVATACGPVAGLAERWLGDAFQRVGCQDSYVLFTRLGVDPTDLRCILIAHMDEIGGVALGRRDDGLLTTRHWGCAARLFADAELQAIDYLSTNPREAYPVQSEIALISGEERLLLRSDEAQPYRTVWTFREESRIDGNHIEGKALDPRATVFAVLTALRQLDDPRVGALLVMAEECAMDVARKAVTFLQAHAPSLRLIVNVDVPSVANLADADPDLPALRIFEGRNLIDPGFGIRMADRLAAEGHAFHLTGARTGSQTPIFAPLAPVVSVALPGIGIHTRRARMSLLGIERCIDLLGALAATTLTDER